MGRIQGPCDFLCGFVLADRLRPRHPQVRFPIGEGCEQAAVLNERFLAYSLGEQKARLQVGQAASGFVLFRVALRLALARSVIAADRFTQPFLKRLCSRTIGRQLK